MSIDCEDYISSSDSDLTYPNCVEYARITCGNRNSYYMKTERITIGRNSTDGIVDIDVGPQTFVSRKHLEVSYSFQKLKVKCLGKNGIFIDNYFKAHSHVAYELPQECTLRFPSTDVEVTVKQLAGQSLAEDRSDREQNKGSVNRGDLYMCDVGDGDNEGDYDTEIDLYLARSHQLEKQTLTDSDQGQETTTQKDMEIYSKCLPKRRVDMEQCALRVHNVQMDKRTVLPQIIINPRSYRSYSCSSDFIYGQNGQIFGTSIDPKDLAIEYGTETQKPPYSYAQLIVQAVSTCPDRQLTLNGIYNYISKHYPYFKSHDKGWQNSVRHNLSLNRYFLKVPRAQDEPGKGSFWRIDAAYEGKLITQAFRKRRLRNNTCVTSDSGNSSQGPRMVTMAGARTANNVYSFSNRNTKLNTFYTVKRTTDHKTAFIVKKMNDVNAMSSQQLISVVNGHSQAYNSDKKMSVITPSNVFHSNTNSHTLNPVHKRLYPSSIHHVISDSNNTCSSLSSSSSVPGTLFNIDGNLYSATTTTTTRSSSSDLQSIQVISNGASDRVSLVPVVAKAPSCNKYILISSSRAQHSSSLSSHNSLPSVCITGSGSLYRPVTSLNDSSTLSAISTLPSLHLPGTGTFKRPPSTIRHSADTCPVPSADHSIDPSRSDCSSSRIIPSSFSSCSATYPQSMDLDFDTDQFLISSPIMDDAGDLDTSPDLYNIDDDDDHCVGDGGDHGDHGDGDERDNHHHHDHHHHDHHHNDDDDVMWQDSLCFHDVEIEGH